VVTQNTNHGFNLMVTLAMFGSINYNVDAYVASSGNSKVGAKVATIELSYNLQICRFRKKNLAFIKIFKKCPFKSSINYFAL